MGTPKTNILAIGFIILVMGVNSIYAINSNELPANIENLPISNIPGLTDIYIGANQAMVYKFRLEAGHTYIISSEELTEGGDHDIKIYDSNGNVVTKSENCGSDSIEFTPDRSGIYYVKIYTYENHGGEVRFEIREKNPEPRPTKIYERTLYLGPYQYNEGTFEFEAGHTYSISLEILSGGGDYYIIINDPNGNIVKSEDMEEGTTEFTPDRTGEYTIMIFNLCEDKGGRIKITMYSVN